jgi:hypothetical protein
MLLQRDLRLVKPPFRQHLLIPHPRPIEAKIIRKSRPLVQAAEHVPEPGVLGHRAPRRGAHLIDERGELGRQILTQIADGIVFLELANSRCLLVVAHPRLYRSLPWQIAAEEAQECVGERLQVV